MEANVYRGLSPAGPGHTRGRRRRLSRLGAGAIAVALLARPSLPALADAGGPTSITMAPGALTVVGAAPGAFADTSLAGASHTVATTLASYTVSDSTGSGNGWNVSIVATPFACRAADAACPPGGDTFPDGSLRMAPPTVASAGGNGAGSRATPPTVVLATDTGIDSTDGASVKVASAAASTGMGVYVFTPASVGAAGNLLLTIPATAYAATYTSTLTVTVDVGPWVSPPAVEVAGVDVAGPGGQPAEPPPATPAAGPAEAEAPPTPGLAVAHPGLPVARAAVSQPIVPAPATPQTRAAPQPPAAAPARTTPPTATSPLATVPTTVPSPVPLAAGSTGEPTPAPAERPLAAWLSLAALLALALLAVALRRRPR